MKNIFKILLPVFVILLTWACDKNYNEEVDVSFYALNKYQFNINTLTIVDSNNTAVIIGANGVSSTTAEIYDSMLLVSNNFTAIAGNNITFYVKGRATGLVVYPGDSTGNDSRRWEDYPLATGSSVILDPDSDEGTEVIRGGYDEPGNYTANLIATNFYDYNSDLTEKIYSINVTIYSVDTVEYFYYNIVDTNALKSHLGLADTLGFEDVFEDVFMR